MQNKIEKEYLFDFWSRESRKKGIEIPAEDKRLSHLLSYDSYKFPFYGQKEICWSKCLIDELISFLILKLHTTVWMEDRNLWSASTSESKLLGEMAQRAMCTSFFEKENIGNCFKNYNKWKNEESLDQVLDRKPLLVQYPYYTQITDGFGRLLPYLVLVYEGKKFMPFEAYLAQ